MSNEPSPYATDVVKALAEITDVVKGRTAKAGSYEYDYADLSDIFETVRPTLAKHNLAVMQSVHEQGERLAITTILLHESGETMLFGPLTFAYGRDAQSTGSAITYHRRYALLASLGMATEDDDGASAGTPARPAPAAEPDRGPLVTTIADLQASTETEVRAMIGQALNRAATIERVALKKRFLAEFDAPPPDVPRSLLVAALLWLHESQRLEVDGDIDTLDLFVPIEPGVVDETNGVMDEGGGYG